MGLSLSGAASLAYYAPAPVVRTSGARMDESWTAEAGKFVIGGQTIDKEWAADAPGIKDAEGLKELAQKLNPIVGYWDPLDIGSTTPETIAWFRQAEIKHGRVAMFAFVGYCVQSNGIYWPWNLQQPFPFNPSMETISHAQISAAGTPSDQWDALPTAAKLQIFFVIALLEFWQESTIALASVGEKHYVRGGRPGVFPSFKESNLIPHPVPLDFFNPIGTVKKMTPEQRERGLIAELNNGRLAMIGIIGLISASKGLLVPGLSDTPKYAGEPMAAFSSVNVDLPFVADMLASKLPWY